MKKRVRLNAGFTLIETVVSIALIAIVVVSFLTLFSNNFDAIFSMGRKTVANKIAEECLSQYYSGGTITDLDSYNAAIQEKYGDQYTVNIESSIENYSDNLIGDGNSLPLKSVTVTVSYRNGTRSVQLVGLVPG